MASLILAEMTASVSELKKNPMGTAAAGEVSPIAILSTTAGPHRFGYAASSDCGGRVADAAVATVTR